MELWMLFYLQPTVMIVVYDIEALSNLFTCTYYEVKNKKFRQFVICESRNDLREFVEYTRKLTGMIGYNNIDYDYKVIHPLIASPDYSLSGKEYAELIYKHSSSVIENQFKDRPEYLIPQRDLFRIWHFNSNAKRVSLKFLQINMGMEQVQDMPFHHSDTIKESQIQEVLDYNKNDVLATHKFYELSFDRIKLRKTLTERYGVDMSNFSDVRVGEAIFLKELSKRSGINEKIIAKGRTPRAHISGREIVIDIDFKTKDFQEVYEKYKAMTITDTTKTSRITVRFDGVEYEFGFGGLHACRGAGVYYNVKSADVSSFYPNIAIGQRFYPQHLGSVFCDVYKHIYEERKKYPKSSPESAAFKLALNGTFGQSNSEWSCFYDPAFTVKVTVNGQLMLAKLCEEITISGAGNLIMANTDGIEVDVKDEKLFKEVCEAWEKQFNLQLEYATYKKIAIRDANAYIGVKTTGEVKEKNDFETKKEIYKDQSMRIVPIAVREFIVNGIPLEYTIESCSDISMFMIGKRSHNGTHFYREIQGQDLKVTPLTKYVRYYVSKDGGVIFKKIDTRDINLHVGKKMTLFNKWETKPFEKYNVDKSFYLSEAMKLVNSVINNQLSL